MKPVITMDISALDEEALDRVAEGEEIVITRHASAIALLVRTDEDMLQHQLRVLRLEPPDPEKPQPGPATDPG